VPAARVNAPANKSMDDVFTKNSVVNSADELLKRLR
jgi:hypothetical protein